MRPVQDFYPDDFSHCYGCGRLNGRGLHVKTTWNGDATVARFSPRQEHVSMPGFVYGGLLASLIDCHAMATAAAFVERAQGREIGDAPAPRFVTASIKVDFLRPTPHGPELELRGVATEIGRRKVTVSIELATGGTVTARATVVAVPMPATMREQPS